MALVSGSVLGFEILLLRWFTLIHGHHFASMVISLALLGLGAGGSFLRLCRGWLLSRLDWSFFLCCLFLALALPLSLRLAALIRFNPLEIVWDTRQWFSLFELYLVCALPFFFAGTGIGLALTSGRFSISRVYAADLCGAGAGGGLILLCLFLLSPAQALLLLFAGALLAALSAGWILVQNQGFYGPGLLFLIPTLLLVWPGFWPEPVLSEYKGLSRTLLLPGVRKVLEQHTFFGRLTVVRSPRVPFRHAPGLSHHCRFPLPNQFKLFVDGEMFGVINPSQAEAGAPGFTDCLPTAVAYHLLETPRVLCNGAGQGLCILEALEHRAGFIQGVQSNPALVSLLNTDLGAQTGGLYQTPGVRLFPGTVRTFLAAHPTSFDLIRLWTPGTRNVSLRSQPLQEEFDFTVQAFSTYLDHLHQGGLLLVSHWLSPLWTETVKLAATAREVCQARWDWDPSRSMALILSQSTALLVLKKGVLQGQDRDALRTFAGQRGFQALFFDEIEKLNKGVKGAGLLSRMHSLLQEAGKQGRNFKFHVRPATDGSPYFNRFFSWGSLPELWSLRGQGGGSLVQWGYLMLIITLVQAFLAGSLLILLPVCFLSKKRNQAPLLGSLLYFISLGLAFLFVEIGLIQSLTLLVGQPLLTVSVVLVSVLLAAGLGSGRAERIGLVPAVCVIVGLCLLYLLFLPDLIAHCLGWPWWSRLGIGVLVSGLPAYFMGIPFPLGLSVLQDRAPAWTPWAWAVNGCASVVSPLLAVLICLHLGFAWLMTIALGLYLLALGLFFRLAVRPLSALI